jgi:hypothetical protein
MKLKQQEEAVQDGREGGRKKGASPVEKNAAPNDRENIGDSENALFAPRKEDQACDEEVIDHDLNKGKSEEIPDLS